MEYWNSSEDGESLNFFSDKLLDWMCSEDSPNDVLWLDTIATNTKKIPYLQLPGTGPYTP